MVRSYSFCLTINNPSEEEKDLFTIIKSKPRMFRYFEHAIAGYEVGKNNRPHVQGALSFSSPISEQSLRRLLPRAHIEPVKSGYYRAYSYCTKEKTWTEWGDVYRALQSCSLRRKDREYTLGFPKGYNSKNIIINDIMIDETRWTRDWKDYSYNPPREGGGLGEEGASKRSGT